MGTRANRNDDIEFEVTIGSNGMISYQYEAEHEDVVLRQMELLPPTAENLGTNALAEQIARALAPRLGLLLRPVTVPPDDAFVDQDAGLFDREVYLRLARKRYFPVTPVGKKRVARWGDVKQGFAQAGKTDIKIVEPSDDPETDLLNEVRQRAGLQVKGGR